MADNGPPTTSGQLPPPPQPNAGAPGYENGQNAPSNPAHIPPPPLHIPQNTNPIPTAITSPMGGGDKSGIMSPSSGGPFARRAAPEPNKRALYVGGLDPRVTEDVLRQIFETTGHVQNVKIIPDKNVSDPMIFPSHYYIASFVEEPLAWLLTFFYLSWGPVADTSGRFRPRATTTASSSTTTPALPSALCRP
jgi:hypothetical protein